MDFLSTPPVMSTARLPQGSYRGIERGGVLAFHNIPYSAPFERFKAPKPPLLTSQDHDASTFGANCPQMPSVMAMVTGPMPSQSGPQDEQHCNVLSVYAPSSTNNQETLLPVIVFAHGGAFIVGGSQTAWYDSSRLVKECHAIVVCINYRLGAFGYLQTGDQPLACGTQDVIRAMEWVKDNIKGFGGDPENITGFGQSAGASHIGTMLQIRPDLMRRAILQSRPGGISQTTAKQEEVRRMVSDALPTGATLENATTQELLDAQSDTMMTSPGMLPPFMPTVSEDQHKPSKQKLEILIGWNKDDCSCFAKYSNMNLRTGTIYLTHSLVKQPSIEFADTLRKQGHEVTMFEMSWSGEGCDLGAVHYIDLPMIFGTEEAWKDAPMLGSTPWSEWNRRGKILRKAWGDFARDGSKPSSIDGLRVF